MQEEKGIKTGHLLRGSFQLTAATGLVMFTSYAFLVFLARKGGVEVFGHYTIVLSVLLWVERVTAESFKHPFVRASAKNSKDLFRRLINLQLCCCVVAICLLFVLAPFIAKLFNNPNLTAPIRVSAFDIVPFSLFASTMALLKARRHFSSAALSASVYGIGKFVALISLFVIFADLSVALIGICIGSILALSMAWLSFQRLEGLRIKENLEAELDGKMFFLPSMIIIGGSGIFLSLDLWLVQYFNADEILVGHYSGAHNIAKALYAGILSLSWPAISLIASSGGYRRAFVEHRALKKLLLLILASVIGFVALCVFAAEPLSVLMFGVSFAPTAEYMRILIPAYAVLTLSLVMMQIAYHSGRAKVASVLTVLGLPSYLLLGYFLAPDYGIVGIVVALFTVSLALVVLAYAALRME